MSDLFLKPNPTDQFIIEDEPSFADSFKAAYGYQYAPIISRAQEEVTFGGVARDPDFDPFDFAQGYEGYEDDIVRAKNADHLDFIKNSIDENLRRRKVMEEADFFSGALVAGIVDPLNIAFAIPVFGQIGLTAKVGQAATSAALASASAAAAAEVVRAPFDPVNTTGETTMNLLTTTAFGTVLGTAPSAIRSVAGSYTRSAKNLRSISEKQDVDLFTEVPGGSGLKETGATDSWWFRLIPTPGKRLLTDKELPELIKDMYVRMEGNGAMALEKNLAGKGVQSIRQRNPIYTMKARNFIADLRAEYNLEVKGRKSLVGVAGIDYEDPARVFGFKGNFGKWFGDTVDRYIQMSDPAARASAKITEAEERVFKRIRDFNNEFLQDAQDVGLLQDVTNIDKFLVGARDQLDVVRTRQQELDLSNVTDPARRSSEAQRLATKAEELEASIKYYEGFKKYYAGSRSDYIMPIYYDKARLAADEALKGQFTDVVERNIAKETHYWDNELGEWLRKPANFNARERAEKIVGSILGEEEPDLSGSEFKMTGSKHLRHRALNIPISEIKDFIIKDERVFFSYAQRMGRRIEWSRNFGNKNIDDVLDEAVEEMERVGLSEKKIAQVKRDLSSEYVRVMGQVIRNPDSFTNQAAQALKEASGLTYLHGAGISAVADTGMIVFERGLGKILAPLVDQTGNVGELFSKAKKDVERIVEGTQYVIPGVQQRVIGDSLEGFNPNFIERVFNPVTSAFYNIPLIGNNLGAMTRYGKIVDGTYRQSELIDMAVRVAKNDRNAGLDVEYLARYGIEIEDAKRIAAMSDIWEVSDSGNFYFANRSAWPVETKAQRDLALKFDTAMNSGAGNTIMHATSFDKPMIVDGVVYVRHYPWMEKLPFGKLTIDKRASTENIKYARLESKALALPFQFMNFSLAATNRITAQMFDPSRRYRVQGAIALFTMAYLSLSIKKPDWWFETKSSGELAARIADQSGIFGIYSDLAYMGLHAAIANDVPGLKNLPGKYTPTGYDSLFDPLGAGPGMAREWVLAVDEMLSGDVDKGKSRFFYNTPSLPLLALLGLNEDSKELWLK